MIEDYAHIQTLANNDVSVLRQKGLSYGSSWRNRGGVGAFMMLARKWDRIENQCKAVGYDIFAALNDGYPEGILDDIQDLRRYLLLVESHIMAPSCMPKAGPALGMPVLPRDGEEVRKALANAVPPPAPGADFDDYIPF